MSEEPVEKWLGTKEVQEYLGIGRETVSEWIAKRGMPAYKVGRFWRFKISEIDEWIRTGEAADPESGKEDTDA